MSTAIDKDLILSKAADMRQTLQGSVIGRDEEIDLILVGMLCNEHVLFVGPPGTGKSFLCDNVAKAIDGEVFSILLGRFSEIDEVFGPLSLKAMENDERIRVIEGMLPTADIGFVDEIWKGSSAILNSLLRIMNERQFKQGTQWMDCNLRCLVAASNEWPTGEKYEGLAAAFDRFLIRKEVMPLSPRHRKDLIFGNFPQINQPIFNREDLDHAADLVSDVEFSDEMQDALLDIIQNLNLEGINPGDRRMRQCASAVKAQAFLCGRDRVELEDLEVTKHILWDDPTEQPVKTAEIVMKVANPGKAVVDGIFVEIEEIIREIGPSPKMSQETMSGIKKLGECINRLKKHSGNAYADQILESAKETLKTINQAILNL